MKAKDVMTQKVYSVNLKTPVHEIARLLLERQISAVPVIDEGNRVLGIVSEGDLMRRVEGERHRSWWLGLVADPRRLARDYVKSHGRDAQSVMTREVITVTEDTPLADIAQLLEKERIKRVPVLRDGRLVGIVSRANIIQGLAARSEVLEVKVEVDDVRIRKTLLDTLDKEPWATAIGFNVLVDKGTVHLYGVVDSDAQRGAVEVAAQNVPGVRAVENHLQLTRDLPSQIV